MRGQGGEEIADQGQKTRTPGGKTWGPVERNMRCVGIEGLGDEVEKEQETRGEDSGTRGERNRRPGKKD
jgi:hypothetical protein